MKVTGTTTLDAPVEKVWSAFLDPRVLAGTIPGCESLEATAENEYTATVTVGVGSVKGSYKGKVQLSDLVEHEGLRLHAVAAGAAGTLDVNVDVTLTSLEGGTTQVDYDADAVVGGLIGGVGQRMLTSVSKRMAKEFFGNINKAILAGGVAPAAQSVGAPAQSASGPAAPPAAPPAMPAPLAAPAASSGAGTGEFLKGLALGALITLLGVAVGGLIARRK